MLNDINDYNGIESWSPSDFGQTPAKDRNSTFASLTCSRRRFNSKHSHILRQKSDQFASAASHIQHPAKSWCLCKVVQNNVPILTIIRTLPLVRDPYFV